jgi:hypothetical protein
MVYLIIINVLATFFIIFYLYYSGNKNEENKNEEIKKLKERNRKATFEVLELANQNKEWVKKYHALNNTKRQEKTEFINDLLDLRGENINLKSKLSKFERIRDEETGKFIKND